MTVHDVRGVNLSELQTFPYFSIGLYEIWLNAKYTRIIDNDFDILDKTIFLVLQNISSDVGYETLYCHHSRLTAGVSKSLNMWAALKKCTNWSAGRIKCQCQCQK